MHHREAEVWRVDSDWRLDQLSKRFARGGGGMICFVMEACKGELQQSLEQWLLSCKPLLIPSAGNAVLAVF